MGIFGITYDPWIVIPSLLTILMLINHYTGTYQYRAPTEQPQGIAP